MIITANLKVSWYEGRLRMSEVRDLAAEALAKALPASTDIDINVDGEVYVEVVTGLPSAVDLIAALESEGYSDNAEWTSVFENVIIDED